MLKKKRKKLDTDVQPFCSKNKLLLVPVTELLTNLITLHCFLQIVLDQVLISRDGYRSTF